MHIKQRIAAQWNAFKCNRDYNASENFAREYVARHHLPPLNAEEKAAIDTYWGRFGIEYKDYCSFQMYYHATGQKDPRFISAGIADFVLYPYYNDWIKIRAWTDKNYFQRFLPFISFPETYGRKINGIYYDNKHNSYLPEEDRAFCEKVWGDLEQTGNDQLIIKQTINTSQGKGVKKYIIRSIDDLIAAIAQWKSSENYIIQRAVEQHLFFAQFNRSSVNIIRITTFRRGKEIVALAPCIRFGVEGSHTDVAFVNGKEIINAVGILPDGHIMDESVTLYGEKIPVHVKNDTVPMWQTVLETVKEGHRHLECFGFVGWDVVVDRDERIICIEYNLISPGVLTYQFAHGPLAGEYTDDVLSFLDDPKNRERFIPTVIRKQKR